MQNIEIQLIRNATLKVTYAGETFLVDPMLSSPKSFRSFVKPEENLNPTVDLPFPTEKITQGITAILLTHSHPDHFDPAAMEALPKDLPFYMQPPDLALVKNASFTKVETIHTSTIFEGITITRTGGKHGPKEILEQLGQVSGFVLQAINHPTIYIVGDCLWDDEIENNIKTYQPDIIITNSGGAVFMGKYRILMDEKETIKVAKTAPKANIIAVHLESLDHCQTTREVLRTKAAKKTLNILVPEDGEVIKM
ncbi:MBL fold metallo-hydrolase [Flammeovirgaceae bacterium SG7u.111]|nr:MBL fold metallo-hydrolase [Flammeovirgaceae bacterium SG7u.132]WPO34996.1 MBL fold metallo-hydrolase [Flammeovirgaceae bacterium SG7u.111]